jgi:hypothetical protein
MTFTRIRVPGEERVDLDRVVAPVGATGRDALK